MFTVDLTGHSLPSPLTNIIRGREGGGDKHVYSVLRYETEVDMRTLAMIHQRII